MDDEADVPVSVVSGYGARTKRGFVSLTLGDHKPIQLSSAEARRVAGLLLDMAGAADGDAFLVAFMRDTVGITEYQAAQIMVEFRAWRKEREE